MIITWQTVIAAASVAAAVAAIAGYLVKAHNWYLKQARQDKDIADIKNEQTLLVYGVLACLQGLREQGCNGPVTEAISKIEKHINQRAHE